MPTNFGDEISKLNKQRAIERLAHNFAADYLIARDQPSLIQAYNLNMDWGDSLLEAMFRKFAEEVKKLYET